MFAGHARSVHLTSYRNPLLKDVRRAAERGTLTADGLCVAETFHLLEEAIRSGCEIPIVIASDSVASTVERRVGGLKGVHLVSVPEELFAAMSATESSQGVMALVRPLVWDLDAVFRGQSLVVVLDGVQDPGNTGAILRAAEAFGASGALFIKGSTSPFNPKAIRGSAGSVFRLPLLTGLDQHFAIATLAQRRVDIYAAMPRAVKAVSEADLRRRCALVIGSEGRGISDVLSRAATQIRIPCTAVESLNAAVAAGVLLYEASRQRRPAE